jgi:IS605 OrfB family transposase
MAYGSSDKKKIKTKRISASSIVNSKKTERFVEHFSFVKSLKNEISQYVFEHKLSLLSSTSKNTLISHAKQHNCPELYSWEVQKMYQQIIDFYSNWVDKLTDNQKFVIQKEYKVTRYKRKVTNSVGEVIAVKGDIKKTEVIHKTTALTNLSNWLIYVDSSMLDSVLKAHKESEENPKKIKDIENFNSTLNALRTKRHFTTDGVEVFLWDRIKALLLRKQIRMLQSMKSPIVFSTGSYMKIPKIGQTKHSYLHVDETNEYKYWYNFRIGKEHIHVPLAFNPKYHGDINDFDLDAIHTVRLNRKNRIEIGLTYEDEKEYFKPLEKDSIIDKKAVCGIDINVSSNFCTIAFHDREIAIDYNREYLQKVVKSLQSFEKKGFKQLTTYEQTQFNKLLGGVEFHFKELISKTLKSLIDDGITDIVLEDLNLSQCKASFIKDETLNIKYSKLIRLLRLSSIKDWFQEQANNKGIRVHLTTPSYTSKTCSKCHCVEHTVRQGRSFHCNFCGHKEDADQNAAKNVRNRITEEVLRLTFHLLKDGQYSPSKMKRETVRVKLTALFEVDNERQRLGKVSKTQETSSFRAG